MKRLGVALALFMCCVQDAGASDNPYLAEVRSLPSVYLKGGCRNPGHNTGPTEIEASKTRLTSRYSWAIPTQEAIDEIAAFSGGTVVDFGAGSGYWAKLLSTAGVDVVAFDDWSWGKPDPLWFPVMEGNEANLAGTSSRTLMMVWPPKNMMPLYAFLAWGGDRLVYVGELFRGNGVPLFFEEIGKWRLVRKIEIPQWWNRNDAVYLLERDTTGNWMPRTVAEAGCVEIPE